MIQSPLDTSVTFERQRSTPMPRFPDQTEVSFIWVYHGDASDLRQTFKCYAEAIDRIQRSFELVIVNNGMGQDAVDELMAVVHEHRIPATLVNLNHVCPASAALLAGFRQSSGLRVAVLPDYAQSDPHAVETMLQAAEEGLDYVASRRVSRVDGHAQQFVSKIFNWVVRTFSRVPLHDINSGLKVMHRQVLESVPLYAELHVFLPILAAREGFRVGEVPVTHLEERTQTADRGLGVYLRRGLDLLTLFFLLRFTQKPFRFFGSIGSGMFFSGGLIVLILGIQRIMGQSLADRPMLVLGTLLMVLGIQTFSLGLIGELIIFSSAGGMKDYQVEDIMEITSVDSKSAHEEISSKVS